MSDPIEQFRVAIQKSGLNPPQVIAQDGKLHRFATQFAVRATTWGRVQS